MTVFHNFCVHCSAAKLPSETVCPHCGKTQVCETSAHVYALFSKIGAPIDDAPLPGLDDPEGRLRSLRIYFDAERKRKESL